MASASDSTTSTIILDVRENKLQKFLPSATLEPLEVGDIWIKQNDTLKFIIERKTISDLAASLKDGRWHEQKCRLLQKQQECNVPHIVYAIEGNMSFNEECVLYGIKGKALVTMLLKAMFLEKITVVFTKNVIDTVDFINGLATRIDKLLVGNDSKSNEEAYQEFLIKSKKSENVTKDTIFIQQLCAIPKISSKKARALIDELKVTNMKELIEKLNNSEDPIAIVKNVHGFGKILAQEVCQGLMGT